MKIHLDNCNMLSNSGPNSFAQRFAKCLFESGHDVILDNGENADISLIFIEPSGKKLAKKIVQRLDGLWIKPQEFHTKNKNIKSLYQIADAVVYQSDFDKTMITKWWGDVKHGAVIRNGIDIKPVTQFTLEPLLQLRQQYKKIFVCSANWHPQKRLKTNIELFKHIRSTIEPSSCLLVMGANPDCMVADRDIFYAGSQPHEVCLEVFSAADWLIHLAWGDHSPNVVCEALSQGTPVICSDVGGTKELIGEFGIVLKDELYNFQLFDYDNPPFIDVLQLKGLPSKSLLGNSAQIDIKNVTKNYLELFDAL